jgi:hypothetical protein
MSVNGGDNKTVELANRATAVSARLDALYARRRELSLAAAEGDKNALKQIENIDTEVRELTATKLMLRDAVLLSQEQDRERQAEREQQDREKHLAEANRVATAALKATEQIDATMVALRKQFEHRAELISQLSRTGCLPSHLSFRFFGRTAGNAAARAAGLDAFLDIAHVAPAHRIPLAETCAILRNPLTWPAEQKTAPATPPPPTPTTTSSPPRFRLFGAGQQP